MKRIFLLFTTTLLLLCSCDFTSSYGKKIKINESLEVYLKGDNVTESDAKKLGNYLADLWKDAANMKSLQLMKESGTFTVRMVVDEKMVKEQPNLDAAFAAVKTLLETDVFQGNPVKFITTDNKFNDIKTY